MAIKKRKPDLTFDVGSFTLFEDSVRGESRTSPGIVIYGDSEAGRADGAKAGHVNADAPTIKLARLLEDCLQTAQEIKSKRASELVRMLRRACNQIETIRAKR